MSQEVARLRADLRKLMKDSVPQGVPEVYPGGPQTCRLFGRRRYAENDSLTGIYR